MKGEDSEGVMMLREENSENSEGGRMVKIYMVS